MTELSDVVKAQERTTLLLRAFLKIFLIYFSSSLIIGASAVGYAYSTVHNLTGCTLGDLTGTCSTNNLPIFFEVVIVVVGIAAIAATYVIGSQALKNSATEEVEEE